MKQDKLHETGDSGLSFKDSFPKAYVILGYNSRTKFMRQVILGYHLRTVF